MHLVYFVGHFLHLKNIPRTVKLFISLEEEKGKKKNPAFQN